MATPKTPAPKRIDPAPGPVDSFLEWNSVRDKDPNRHYVLVSKTGGMNPDYYDALGFEVENYRPGGPNLQGGAIRRRKEGVGKPIEHFDHMLMSCTLERWAEIQLNGYDGRGGQREADRRDAQVLVHRGQRDPMRGQGVKNHMGYLPKGLEYDEGHDAAIPQGAGAEE